MSSSTDDFAAMILTAGRGQRMRPLSDVLPKPALPILDRPVAAWALELAIRTGARSLAANVWHLAGLMEAAIRSASAGRDVGISHESELLGGAGGLAAARDQGLLGEEGTVLVLNGDSLTDLDLTPVFERHQDAGDLVTLALLPHPDPGRWSGIALDRSGRVSALVPPGTPGEHRRLWLYPGVMLVARELLDAIPSGPGEISERLWAPARRAGRMGGVIVRGTWREVGTPDAYREAVLNALDDASWRHRSAAIAPDVRLIRSMAGEGVTVGPGAILDQSVISHGTTVGAGCRLEGSVVLGPLTINPGTVLRGAILGEPLPESPPV